MSNTINAQAQPTAALNDAITAYAEACWHHRLADMRSAYTALVQAAQAQPAAVPETSTGWLRDGALLYRLTDDRKPANRDEIRVTMADGLRSDEACSRRAGELFDRLAAPLAAVPAVPPGYALVPVEPTLQMVEAGRVKFMSKQEMRNLWAAMLAAAPAQGEQA